MCARMLCLQDMLRRGLEAHIVDKALRAFFGDEQHSLRVTPNTLPTEVASGVRGGNGGRTETGPTRDSGSGLEGLGGSGRSRRGSTAAAAAAAAVSGTGMDRGGEGLGEGGSRGNGVGGGGQFGEGGGALGDELLEVVRKRHASMQHLPEDTQRRRLTGYLQRRGHSWGTARQVLQQLGLMR